MKYKFKWIGFVLACITLVFLIRNNMSDAANTDETINLKADLNFEMTQELNKEKLGRAGLKKQFDIDELTKVEKNSNIKLDLNIDNLVMSDNKTVSGKGKIKIGSDTYQFEFADQMFPVYRAKDGTEFYSGGLTGTLKGKYKEEMIVIGLDYIPSTKQYFINTSVGTLNEDTGLSILFFGKPILTKEYADIISNK